MFLCLLFLFLVIADEKYGSLSCHTMNTEFESRGCDSNISKLIRTFLNEFHIIHQVSKDYCLVPSAISSIPAIPRHVEKGSFPRKAKYMYTVQQGATDPSLPSILPMACNSPEEIQLKVTDTGLVYRRFMLLPPIASGFWSKLIALFLQKKDFNKLVEKATPVDLALKAVGPAHRLRCMIGDLELNWVYWKTGIMLYISEYVALRVNSYQTHEFEDPFLQNSATDSVFSSRQQMLSNFLYRGADGYESVPDHYKEVIEVVAPELHIERANTGNIGEVNRNVKPLSAKLLTKALEIIDEVVKNHCEHLTTTGIYSLNDMRHVIPCPLCYGDEDQREHLIQHRVGPLEDSLVGINPMESLNPGLTALGVGHVNLDHQQGELDASTASQAESTCDLPDGSIWVFTVESCIEQTFSSDLIKCPKHGPLEIECLAPDLVSLAIVVLLSGMLCSVQSFIVALPSS